MKVNVKYIPSKHKIKVYSGEAVEFITEYYDWVRKWGRKSANNIANEVLR